MQGKKENRLIVIESGQLNMYHLDDQLSWEIGRLARDNYPDIKLHVPTVSRKHGRFININGNWFYMDHKGKNGTVYNNRRVLPGIKGRIKPVSLQSGDVLIFGGGEEAVVNCKTVWSMFVTTSLGDRWRVEDTKGIARIAFGDGNDMTRMENPPKGTVIEKENGMAIYMGDITYLLGDIEVKSIG